jgi:valyl-tRNA synthetase
MMNLGDDYTSPAGSIDGTPDVSRFTFPARWILSRLSNATGTTIPAMEKYDFSTASQAVYRFWQSDLCDVFIELMRPLMRQENEAAKDATRAALLICLDRGLRLLHPTLPFVTEQLWQRLPGQNSGKSIMMAEYPAKVPAWEDATAEANMAYLMNVVTKVRALRNDYSLVKEKPSMHLSSKE